MSVVSNCQACGGPPEQQQETDPPFLPRTPQIPTFLLEQSTGDEVMSLHEAEPVQRLGSEVNAVLFEDLSHPPPGVLFLEASCNSLCGPSPGRSALWYNFSNKFFRASIPSLVLQMRL